MKLIGTLTEWTRQDLDQQTKAKELGKVGEADHQ